MRYINLCLLTYLLTRSVENTHHPLSLLSSSLWDCLPLNSFLHFTV